MSRMSLVGRLHSRDMPDSAPRKRTGELKACGKECGARTGACTVLLCGRKIKNEPRLREILRVRSFMAPRQKEANR